MTEPRQPRPFQPNDRFFRLIPEVYIDDKHRRISPGAFSNTSGTLKMSVDWAHLSTPQESAKRWENTRAVGQFVQQDATDALASDMPTVLPAELQNQQYDYDPIPNNRSHCNVTGKKPESVCKRFARVTKLVSWPSGWTVPDELATAMGDA